MWEKKHLSRHSRIVWCVECGSKRVRWAKSGKNVRNFYCYDCEKYLSLEPMLAQMKRK